MYVCVVRDDGYSLHSPHSRVSHTCTHAYSPGWIGTDYFVDFLFICDIAVSFRTAFFEPSGHLVVDTRGMAKNYLFTWFWIDAPASFPFELILAALSIDASQLRFISVMKCIRLLRLGRLLKFFDRFQFAHTMRVGRLLAFFVLCVHWAGCVYYLEAVVQGVNAPGVWVCLCQSPFAPPCYATSQRSPHDCPAPTPLQTSTLDLENVSVFQMYIKSMYLGLCQLVGENLDPQTTVEQVMAILMVLYGSVMNASLFGQVGQLHQLHQLSRGALEDALCHLNMHCCTPATDCIQHPKLVKHLQQAQLHHGCREQQHAHPQSMCQHGLVAMSLPVWCSLTPLQHTSLHSSLRRFKSECATTTTTASTATSC